MRVVDPRQQGSRIAWSNPLFELVERVPDAPPPRPMPQPEVVELELKDFHAAQLQQELREVACAR